MARYLCPLALLLGAAAPPSTAGLHVAPAASQVGSKSAAAAHKEALVPEPVAAAAVPAAAAPARKPGGLIFIAIVTAPAAVEKRKEIRATWLKHSLFADGTVSAAFFVGKSKDAAQNAAIDAESRNFTDIHRLESEEGYDNLTPKTYGVLRYFERNRGDRYLMKLDDDTYPHLDLLAARLRNVTQEMVLLGHIFPCAPVLKETKWKEDPKVFGDDFYPTYAQGSGYILSRPLVERIVGANADHPPMLHNEDASVGFWIQREREKDSSFKASTLHLYSSVYGCNVRDYMTMNLWKGDMTCMWRKKQEGKSNICCDVKDEHGVPVLLQTGMAVDSEADEEETGEGEVSLLALGRGRSLQRARAAAAVAAASRLGTGCYRHGEIWDVEAAVGGDALQH